MSVGTQLTAARAVARRLSWGVVDQGVSSLSNFALGVFAVRVLSPADFGAFSLAFITYSVVLNASRGLSTDPLLVRYSGATRRVWRGAVAASSGTAIYVGLLIGGLCVLASPILPAPLDRAFLVLGLFLPALTLQDSWRFAFFSAHKGAHALANDVVWTIAMIAGLVQLALMGAVDLTSLLVAFGTSAGVAALFGCAQTGICPSLSWSRVRAWLVEHRSLGTRYLIENVSGSGASLIRSFVLGASVGLAEVGAVRATEMLMGPFMIVLMGVSQVAVPEATRLVPPPAQRMLRFCAGLGAVQAALAVIWGAVIALALPHGLGSLLLGNLWTEVTPLLTPVILTIAAACFSTGAAAGLRAYGASRRSLRAQLWTSGLYVTLGSAGALAWGALGACWGAATANAIGAAIWWSHLQHEAGRRRVRLRPDSVARHRKGGGAG